MKRNTYLLSMFLIIPFYVFLIAATDITKDEDVTKDDPITSSPIDPTTSNDSSENTDTNTDSNENINNNLDELDTTEQVDQTEQTEQVDQTEQTEQVTDDSKLSEDVSANEEVTNEEDLDPFEQEISKLQGLEREIRIQQNRVAIREKRMLDAINNPFDEGNVSHKITSYQTVILTGPTMFLQPRLDNQDGIMATRVVYAKFDDDITHRFFIPHNPQNRIGVQVLYDPNVISFSTLVGVYFRSIDPTSRDSQFCYSGSLYAPVILYNTPEQLEDIEAYMTQLEESHPVLAKNSKVRFILQDKHTKLTVAPLDHQQYYKQYKPRFDYFMHSCSVDITLQNIWSEN